MDDPLLLSEVVLSVRGPVRTTLRYWGGHHPERGQLHRGLTGAETVEECARVRALYIVRVYDRREA